MLDSILITGASSGIGRELAKNLAKTGKKLILVGRDDKKLAELARELKCSMHIVAVDLADPKQIVQVVNLIKEHVPTLVINSAGSGLYGPVLSHTIEEELHMVRLNIEALMEITIESAKALIAKGRQGTILNISSVASYFQPYPNFATYSASKSFVTSFSRAMDFELKPKGIRILTSAPGQVDTLFRRRASKGILGKTSTTMDVRYAVKRILKQIKDQKSIDIFDWRYKLLAYFNSFVPRSFLAKSVDTD